MISLRGRPISFAFQLMRSSFLNLKTCWDSTYLMVQTALYYEDVFFSRLKQHERNYKCLPSEIDWSLTEEICGMFFWD